MQRTFAGILGSTAFTICVVHGWAMDAGADGTIGRAALGLVVFAVLGAIAGHVAKATVEEGVTNRLHKALSTKRKQ